MKRVSDLKPWQLAGLTILGGALQGSIFVLPAFHTHHDLRIWVPVAAALFVGGMILTLKCVSALKKGIQNEQWPPAQIEPLRATMDSPFTILLLVLLFGGFAVLNLMVPHSHSMGWALYMPAQALSQIMFAFRQKAKKGPPIDFHTFGPINSEHWGKRQNP